MNGREKTKKGYIDALNEFLLNNFAAGKNAVLLIDEAQNLSHSVLEQIRMLSNLETIKEKLIQIILIGQPELHDLLTSLPLRQLNERITVRYALKNLDEKNVQNYIEHRLSIAGGKNTIKFSSAAFRVIHSHSQGNPRRINAICDRALLIAYTKDVFTINRKTVKETVKDIGENYLLGEIPAKFKKRGRFFISRLF
jgi:general secretion pathway protein A